VKQELLIGCGHKRDKRMFVEGEREWSNLTTLDMYPECTPDVLHDLNVLPLPFGDNAFDEIHAYEVLEHLGRLGDFKQFFALFNELHRILKPGGLFFATVPNRTSPWALGDPGHTRVISIETLAFLSQNQYEKQEGNTPMSDYRPWYRGDFEYVGSDEKEHTFAFILKAKKEAAR